MRIHLLILLLIGSSKMLFAMDKQNDLVIASLNGDDKKIRDLISENADPNQPNKSGLLP